MKEMVYRATRSNDAEILLAGKIKWHQFYIVSYGTHPCAYVRTDLSPELNDVISVHGGIPFSRNERPEFAVKGHYIGWDYMHAGDYIGEFMLDLIPESELAEYKRYTTEEILEEVKSVIDQVVALEESNGKYKIDSNTSDKVTIELGRWDVAEMLDVIQRALRADIREYCSESEEYYKRYHSCNLSADVQFYMHIKAILRAIDVC